MRQIGSALAAAAFIVSIGSAVHAKMETLKGQLVDEECYLREKQVDADAACAVSCAKSGKPVALLTADGKVYQITGGLAANKNARLAAHMLHTVEITGEVTEKDGKLALAADALTMIKK